jgi:hypothetical protein
MSKEKREIEIGESDHEAGTAVESGPAEAGFRRMSAVSLAPDLKGIR